MLKLLASLVLLFTFAAAQNPEWNAPEKPFRLAGRIYYVGTAELACFLIHTPQGHILVDGGMPSTAPLIEQSIRELGFKPEDIRILLATQAHFDHVGSHAHFKKLSGARVEAMTGDAELLRNGGKSDYLMGSDPAFHFPRVAVDRVLKDGDIVTIGGVRLTARHTPGHTPGSTTFLMDIDESGREYQVAFLASVTVNPGTRLVKDPSYPGILEDYRQTFEILESLKPDIFVSGHASFFNLKAKRARMNEKAPAEAFVDPDGYSRLIANRKKDFEALVEKQKKS